MARLYDLRDLRYWVYQPTSVRWRHRYKGVRESLKVNQEIGQYYYDIKNADYKLDNIDDQFEEDSDLLLNGGYLDGVQFNFLEDSTPTDEPVYLLGFEGMIGRVEQLRNRIRSLEGK